MTDSRFGVEILIDGDDDAYSPGTVWFDYAGVPVPNVGEVLTFYVADPASYDDEPEYDKPTTQYEVVRREFGYRGGGGRTEGWVVLFVRVHPRLP